ncbi:DUF3592 domain-containing protein [Mesorhizobium sp.]|uniref:DUF3592 domain-containing protein n=1 Tax=Mesorhizobium sp. TaxID=1871066 RepID=UPI000FEA6646|nr:MAG: DUF3592 domain-containing protein [Mesorhizobium sp.]RWC61249.1 MAG: DUF3592 domain-containing protein [Mesorhizobium sp.]
MSPHASFIIACIFVILAAIIFIGYVFGYRQQKRFAGLAESWPVVECRVVERLYLSADPMTYRYMVEYRFDGNVHKSIAKNFYRKDNTNKYVGDIIHIRVNPENPAICTLYS